MKRMLLDTAMDLMQRGSIPSVSDVAGAAQVSRATAYRYFPHQAAMIQEAVDEALGPILAWNSESTDAEQRVGDLLAFAYPRIEEFEATHRATLLLTLYQWTKRTAGTLGDETEIVRGHRKRLLAKAVAPLRARLARTTFDRLTQSLSLIFGTEAFIVLKDIWGLDGEESRRVAIWAANALVRAATNEAAVKKLNPVVRGGAQKTTRKPRRKQ
jgi:AcrR family transcriptional regulator